MDSRRLLGALGAAASLALLLVSCTPDSELPTDALYGKYCARCHGDHGEGAARFRGKPETEGADLTRSKMVGDGNREDVYRRIAYGHGPMPGYGRKLAKQDIERLVDFVFQLAGRPAATPRKE